VAVFARGVASQTHEHRHQPNRIDGDKNRNKSNEKFVDHAAKRFGERPCSTQMNTSLRVKLRLGKQMEHRFSKIPSAMSESV
jgi:hypothetical protein